MRDSEEETLTSITNLEAITGVVNGTAKTAEALGLPATVTIVTSKGNKTANVTWDVENSTYNVDTKTAQTFDVTGTVELPAGVTNPNTVELTAKVSVTVDAEVPVPVPAPVGADQMAITATTIEGVTTTFENDKVTITIGDSVNWAEVFEAQTPNADLGGEEQYAYVGISVKKPNTPEGITHVLINDGTKDVVAEIGAHDATTADGRFYYFAVAKMIPATEEVEVKYEVLTDTDAKTRIVKWYDSEDGEPILEQKFEVMRVKGE